MNDQTAGTGEAECQEKLATIQERQAELDKLWLQMSGGDTSGAQRYRELRRTLDELRAEYRRTCGELTDSSTLPRSVLADWH